MNNTILENNWKSLFYTGNSNFEFKRIDPLCIPELNIGLNTILNRCLILELPKRNNVDFQSKFKQNLSIEFFRDTNYIVIQLTNNAFYDLFNDLIISIYHKIKSISEVDEYSKVLIQTFYKWSEFFEEKISDRLSIDIVKGLFGELLVLKSLVSESNSSQINATLESWKGPYDEGHDFNLNDKNIEVKTKDISRMDVRISSEFQLEKELDKALELVVISVENDLMEGQSLKDLIVEIKSSISEMLGDTSILLKALIQKGITLANVHQYDNFRFTPISKVVYDCGVIGFPKLIKTNIPKEITCLSYNLRTTGLEEYIITKIDF